MFAIIIQTSVLIFKPSREKFFSWLFKRNGAMRDESDHPAAGRDLNVRPMSCILLGMQGRAEIGYREEECDDVVLKRNETIIPF
jgi:hypothetical protein